MTPSSDQLQARPKVGRNAPKVKTACKTCKLRKVKCDEARPACSRCTSTGRKCDGYGIWGGGSSSTSSVAPLESVRPTIQPKVRITRKETKATGQQDPGNMLRSPPLTASSPSDTAASEDSNAISPELRLFDLGMHTSRPTEQIAATCSIPTSLTLLPGNAEERGMLDWYTHITANKLPGIFSSTFWGSLLLQASFSEPTVLQGVLALTCAHKHELCERSPGRVSPEERFTLQAYTKAIGHLKPHLRLEDTASIRITLMACILFACLELVQERRAIALSHLSSAFRLIAQTENSALKPKDITSLLIARALLKLSVQANLLGSRKYKLNSSLITQTDFGHNGDFTCIEDARDRLDVLIARAMDLSELYKHPEGVDDANRVLCGQKATLRLDLDAWFDMYTKSGLETDPNLPPKSRIGTVVLRMYHIMAMIMTETCNIPHRETAFDSQTSRFTTILSHAQRMWDIVAAWHAYFEPIPPGQKEGSIIDIGWIPAVYYVAIKCRVRDIRVQAIRLLESTHHTEGMWDAGVSATVAREVMRIEEGGCEVPSIATASSLDAVSDQASLSSPALPDEMARICDVGITYLEDGRRDVDMCCRRRREHGRGWEEIYRCYELIDGSWVMNAFTKR